MRCRHRLHKPPARRGIWDDDVYRRVFLTEREALRWWQINRTLGSPGQPYHSQPFAERACKQATALIAGEANFLGAMKLLLMAACVTQEHDAATELGRCADSRTPVLICHEVLQACIWGLVILLCLDQWWRPWAIAGMPALCEFCQQMLPGAPVDMLRLQSSATIRVAVLEDAREAHCSKTDTWAACRALTSHCQEIACVRIRLRSLKSLVTESSPEFAATRDRAALAKSVNSVLACVQRIVSSPKYCYFSGTSLHNISPANS